MKTPPETLQNAPRTLKSAIRIPTATYGYIEFKFEGTAAETIAEHNKLLQMYNGGFGLEQKEWNAALDEYLTTNNLKNGTEIYAQMSIDQQQMFQELKKAIARLKTKNK